jgi:hypothetical protein
MFNFLFKNFIRLWMLRIGWKLIVWVISKKYQGKLITRLVNGVDAMISTRK